MVINLFFLSAVFALSCVGLPLFWYRGKRFFPVQVGICVLEVSLLRFLMKFTDLPHTHQTKKKKKKKSCKLYYQHIIVINSEEYVEALYIQFALP